MAMMNNTLAIAAGIVAVPTQAPNIKRTMSEEQKRKEALQKQKVMRERAEQERTYLREAISEEKRIREGWNQRGRLSSYCHARPGAGITEGFEYNPSNYTRGGLLEPYVGGPCYTDPHTGHVVIPFKPHTYRRQVSAGESEEGFYIRMQNDMRASWDFGVSFIYGACNCVPCCTDRKSWYRSYTFQKDIKQAVANSMSSWDQEYNPYAKNYRYRTKPRRRREDEAGNLPLRGANMHQNRTIRTVGAGNRNGNVYEDPKARGGAARLVGLEVEHNRRVGETDEWLTDWPGAQIITDGSCGYEAVTPPIAGENIRECITQLTDALVKGKAGCDARCGLHIHVDARDMRWADMFRFLAVYCRLESLLFLIGGQNRYAGTSYCRPVAKLYTQALQSNDPKGGILSAACLSDGDGPLRNPADGRKTMAEQGASKKGGGRYKAINIMPWIAGRIYGRPDTTVEFRLHRGSHNRERLIHWAYICQDIVDWCCKATNADVEALPKSAARALAVISPRTKGWVLRRLLGWRKSTTAMPEPQEDDVGNIRPRRIVSMKGGLYLVDKDRANRGGSYDD